MAKRKLVVSTGNKNKVEEIAYILKDFPIEVLSKNDIDLGELSVEEDGDTLEENSMKKARELSNRTNYMVIADDSGLFVDGLDGKPGVHSSRYGGEEGNDRKNNEKLLEELKDMEGQGRKAKFKTVIVLIKEDGEAIVVEGECKGRIGHMPVGNNGFGYDPLFIPEGHTETFGELGEDIKNKISHRAKALQKLKYEIKKII